MVDTKKILEVLDGNDTQAIVELMQPVMSNAVKLGLLPKASPTEICEQNWLNFTKLMRDFIVNADSNIGEGKCVCCDRAEEYNGFSSGPLVFKCPKSCSCHD